MDRSVERQSAARPPSLGVPPALPPRNPLGQWSFALSAGGLLTLGVLCPIGLGLGIAALPNRPRGFAVAGIAVGVGGTVLAAFWGAGIAMRLVDRLNASRSCPTLFEAIRIIEQQRPKLGRRPTTEEGQAAISRLRDAWGKSFLYYTVDGATYGTGDCFKLGSAGPDGVFHTSDDMWVTGSISHPVIPDGR